jgi:hypothetical protein
MASIDSKSMLLFITQMLIVLVVVLTSIVNLSINNKDNREFWISLLCSTIGYILPNPKLKTSKNKKDAFTSSTESESISEFTPMDITDSPAQLHSSTTENK